MVDEWALRRPSPMRVGSETPSFWWMSTRWTDWAADRKAAEAGSLESERRRLRSPARMKLGDLFSE